MMINPEGKINFIYNKNAHLNNKVLFCLPKLQTQKTVHTQCGNANLLFLLRERE